MIYRFMASLPGQKAHDCASVKTAAVEIESYL